MTGKAYELSVKHATTGEWIIIGPGPRFYSFYQFETSVQHDAEIYESLGLQTMVREFEMEYDSRG